MSIRPRQSAWGRPPARRRARAFTLIELLVSVVILALMVAIVGVVMSQSQRVVRLAEARIRSNAAAANIAHMIREDFRSASKNGVMCLTDTSSTDLTPRLILTTAGVTHSVTHTTRGTGAFICYGLVPNQAAASDANRRILWRPGWVLTRTPDPGWLPSMDIWVLDFSTLQGYTRQLVDGNIISHPAFTGSVGNLRVPPAVLDDIQRLWQVGVTSCSRLSIMWTDGTVSGGNLNWYGRDANGVLHAKDPGWFNRTQADLDNPANFSRPEYDGDAGSGQVYRVLWTHHNQNAWPKAIKIRFALRDPAMPDEFQDVDYEVVATIGQ